MKKIILTLLTFLALSSSSHAQFGIGLENLQMPSFSIIEEIQKATGVDLLSALTAACNFSGANYICQTKDIVRMVDNLGRNGLEQLKQVFVGIPEAWVKDLIVNLGDTCIDPATGAIAFPEQGGARGQCVNDLTNTVYNWLQTEPKEFYKRLNELTKQIYITNLRKTWGPYGPSNPEPIKGSATWWMENAVRSNPFLSRQLLSIKEESAQLTQESAKMTFGLAESLKTVQPNAATAGFYNRITETTAGNNLNPTECPDILPDPTRKMLDLADKPVIDPCIAGGGIAYKAQAAAKTAASSREVLQGLVDLQAEMLKNDIMNTAEVGRNLQTVAGLTARTNVQLDGMYKLMIKEALQKEAQFKSRLEQDLAEDSRKGDLIKNGMIIMGKAIEEFTDENTIDLILEY
jgi:hypothetical protein